MDTTKTLLRAIVEDPDDDLPRLAYADWLEERGDDAQLARAEFIRVQIALSRMPDDDPARPALVVREALLLRRHGDDWGKEIKGLGKEPLFRRGFIAEATVTVPQFVRHGAKLLARAPVTTARLGGPIHATAIAGQLRDLATCPALGQLRGLDLRAVGPFGVAQDLVQSPVLRGLRALHLNCFGDEDVGRFAKAHALESLEQLWLGFCIISDAAVRRLVATPWFPRLTHLELQLVQRTPRGIDVLVAALPPALEYLTLSGLEEAGVRRLARAAKLPRLKSLRLSRSNTGTGGLAALVESPLVEGLTWLDLGGSGLGVDGAEQVARAPRLATLTRLDMPYNSPLGDRGARHLAESRHLGRLTSLDLSHNQVGPDGAAALAASRNAKRLAHLNLGMNAIGDPGAAALARSPYLRPLNDLVLFDAQLGLPGVRALTASPILDHVVTLDLRENALSPEGVEALVTSPRLGEHATLHLPYGVKDKAGPRRRFAGRIEFG